jgi:hypothetical protein
MMAGKIQQIIFFKKLKKLFDVREPKRTKRLLPLSEANSILILFDASEEQNSLIVFSIIKTLQDMKMIVRSVGYVPYKQNPHWCFPKISYDYINKKNTSFAGFPRADFVDDILRDKYDILIDFLSKPVAPMCYLSALTQSDFKIARQRDQHKFFHEVYDLIIENSDMNDRDYFYEIRRVLKMLNNGIE